MGVGAAFYIRLISWAGLNKPKHRAILFLPAVIFTALGFVAIPFPQLLGNGRNVVQLAFDDGISIPLLACLLILKPVATAACLRTGIPGGLFTPTMTTGALMGGLLGKLWTVVWPGAPAGSYALIGAGAMLAATTLGPISAIALMLDLTRRIDPIMIPLMLAVAIASAVARMLESQSIYSGRIPLHLPSILSPKDARNLGLERESVISAAAPYATVLQHFLTIPKDVVYVIDRNGKRAGAILRSRLATSAADFGDPKQIATAYDLAEPAN
jgi:chloride channel protein, CIC family